MILPDFAVVLARHRQSGVLVDTNILLLFFIGSYREDLVPWFKRTSQFTTADYLLLIQLLSEFERRITLPPILTEVSNLSNQLESRYRYDYYQVYTLLLKSLFEVHESAQTVVSVGSLHRMGLTDAAIAYFARQNDYLVLTDDAPFANYLSSIGVGTLNFNQLRLAGI